MRRFYLVYDFNFALLLASFRRRRCHSRKVLRDVLDPGLLPTLQETQGADAEDAPAGTRAHQRAAGRGHHCTFNHSLAGISRPNGALIDVGLQSPPKLSFGKDAKDAYLRCCCGLCGERTKRKFLSTYMYHADHRIFTSSLFGAPRKFFLWSLGGQKSKRANSTGRAEKASKLHQGSIGESL